MKADLLLELFDANVLLTHRLTALAQTIHGQGAGSAARRGVMQSLTRHGNLTVPQMARMRPVSRQHIQSVVDELREDELVEILPNPASRRSPLVALTTKGAKLTGKMRKRELRLLEEADLDVSDKRVRQAVETLQTIADALMERVTQEQNND
ncbi:MAG: hypothetical protein JNL98_10530 [Bryobacterales bacterium]|nr:hypothetical protein [Bryobacterales bacterium]